MNIAEVVAKMNVYLLNAADVCRKWLEPRLKSLEPSDWWNMIVLPSLSELQQRKVNEKRDFNAARTGFTGGFDCGHKKHLLVP